jgi:hypothetical protein
VNAPDLVGVGLCLGAMGMQYMRQRTPAPAT